MAITLAFALALAVAALAAACGTSGGNSTAKPDPSKVLHLENRSATAIMVDITSPNAPDYNTAIRPCGGTLDLTAGAAGFSTADWQITLATDPTGTFDAALAAWTGDPHNMPGSFSDMQILWTRGDIATASLPRWITIRPTSIVLTATQQPLDPPATCGPIYRPTSSPDAGDTSGPSEAPGASETAPAEPSNSDDTTPTDPPNADDTPSPS